MIWHGSGSNHSPHVPFVDNTIGVLWQKRGLPTGRKNCCFASTNKDQAQDYAIKGLYLIEPDPQTHVAWIPGVKDVVLELESYMRYDDWDTDLLCDIQGDINLVDTYISMGNKEIIRYINRFLSLYDLMDLPYIDAKPHLETHQGEIWLTGPHRRTPCSTSSSLPLSA